MKEKLVLVGYSENELTTLMIMAVQTALNTQQTKELETVNPWLSRTEAAKYLKVSLPTLRKLTESGKVKAYSKGRKKLFNRNQLDESIKISELKYK